MIELLEFAVESFSNFLVDDHSGDRWWNYCHCCWCVQ